MGKGHAAAQKCEPSSLNLPTDATKKAAFSKPALACAPWQNRHSMPVRVVAVVRVTVLESLAYAKWHRRKNLKRSVAIPEIVNHRIE
jgi:hypothetical protein